MKLHARVLGVLALSALTLALLAAGPRAARAEATAGATENEVPVAGSALPEEAADPGVADVGSDATSLGKWWTDQPWRFGVDVYGWLPDAPVSIETGITKTKIPERFGEILKSLNFMAMVRADVHKGPIGVFADAIYYDGDITESQGFPFQKRDITLDEKVWIVDYGVSYALGPWNLWESAHSPAVTLEPFAGARYLHDKITIDVDPGITVLQRSGKPDRPLFDPKIIGLVEAIDPGSTTTVTRLLDTSIEFNTPIVGLRTRWDLTKRWTLNLRGDIGGWGLDGVNSTYQLAGTIAYNFKMWNVSSRVYAGYRYLYLDYEKDPVELYLIVRGPQVGIGFEF